MNQIIYLLFCFGSYMGSIFQDENDLDLKQLQVVGEEYGATTGRQRQCNWLNLKKLLVACKVNRVNKIFINKCDILEKVGVYKLFDNYGKIVKFNNMEDMQRYIVEYLFDYEITFSGSKNNL